MTTIYKSSLVERNLWYSPSKADVADADRLQWLRRNMARESGKLGIRVPPESLSEEVNMENIIVRAIGFVLAKNNDTTTQLPK